MKWGKMEKWAGLRPMTPSMMPIVEQSKNNKNIFYNTGHGHLGWTLSAFTSKEIVKILKDSV
jgi:D-amino-acid dehydrogenase